MPNSWETTWSFNPTNPGDAELDADLDGLTNVREFLARTNPRDADSDDDGVPDAVETAPIRCQSLVFPRGSISPGITTISTATAYPIPGSSGAAERRGTPTRMTTATA